MTSPVDKLLPLLSGVRSTEQGKWIAKCPAHDDRSPSLGVRGLEDGRLLLHCFSGCSVVDVVCAVGLTLGDLFPEDLKDGCKPLRQPFSPTMVLNALVQEILVVEITAGRMLSGDRITQASYERLTMARQRIEEALRLAGL